MSTGSDRARLIAAFDSIHYVLAAERVFKERGLWCDLVPTPRQISSDCGMVVEFRERDLPAVRAALADPRARQRAIYRPTESGYEVVNI